MEQNTHQRVLYFINLIKGHKSYNGHDAHTILQQVYTRGSCYMFAKALQFVFPQAIIYTSSYFGHHVITNIEGKFYDITGEITCEQTLSDYSPLSKEQEEIAATWSYSHKYEHNYGLHDVNGNRIEKLEALVVDEKNNSWSVPEQLAEVV